LLSFVEGTVSGYEYAKRETKYFDMFVYV